MVVGFVKGGDVTALPQTANTALTMLDLSRKFYNASSEEQRLLLSAAGEAM